MTVRQRLGDYLFANPNIPFCDDCLSSIVQIKPRQQVQHSTSVLGKHLPFQRCHGVCNRCASHKMVTAAVGTSPIFDISGSKLMKRHAIASVSASTQQKFVDLRRALVLVSCVKKKHAREMPARDLYASTWFEGIRRLVEASGAEWFILSALHGLLAPDTVISPYECTLNAMSAGERREWANRVLEKLLHSSKVHERIVIFAGKRYREYLVGPLFLLGKVVEIPMHGLRQGEQLNWLAKCQTVD